MWYMDKGFPENIDMILSPLSLAICSMHIKFLSTNFAIIMHGVKDNSLYSNWSFCSVLAFVYLTRQMLYLICKEPFDRLSK
jgi:hypothetical protein